MQGRAVYLLDRCEVGDKHYERELEFKQRLFATGRFEWDDLFAEEREGEQVNDDDLVVESTTRRGEAVAARYVFQPQQQVVADDAESVITQLLAEMKSGTVSAAQAGEWS